MVCDASKSSKSQENGPFHRVAGPYGTQYYLLEYFAIVGKLSSRISFVLFVDCGHVYHVCGKLFTSRITL